jgi:hypothetical protein
MHFFRGMKADIDGSPLVGNTAVTLGVRAEDIPVTNGFVSPQTGGMSVTHPDPELLPAHRRPPSLGGIAKHPVFFIAEIDIKGNLVARCVPIGEDDSHYCIEPLSECAFEAYEEELHATKNSWIKL